jgi:hypothetical protein
MKVKYPRSHLVEPFTLVALVAGSSWLQATVVVSNIAAPDPLKGTLFIGNVAIPFTTGPIPATLNAVTAIAILDPGPGVTYSARIWSSTDGHPGNVLNTLSDQFSAAQIPTLTFTSSGLTLDANTTYWLELDSDGTTVTYWGNTFLPIETSDYGWTIGDLGRYVVSPWGPYLAGPTPPIGRFAIDATLLPEPAAPLALAASAMTLTLTRRRRRRLLDA